MICICESNNDYLILTDRILCCRGSYSCNNLHLISLSFSILNVSLRCDGYSSCKYANNIVSHAEYGNIYCTGYDSCTFTNIVFVNPSNLYCSGTNSCQYEQFF